MLRTSSYRCRITEAQDRTARLRLPSCPRGSAPPPAHGAPRPRRGTPRQTAQRDRGPLPAPRSGHRRGPLQSSRSLMRTGGRVAISNRVSRPMSRAVWRWACLLLFQEGRQWEPVLEGPAKLGEHRPARQQRHPNRTTEWRAIGVTRAEADAQTGVTAMWRSSTHRADSPALRLLGCPHHGRPGPWVALRRMT